MTQLNIKKQITNNYLSMGGVGYINHQYLLDLFKLVPQQISESIIIAATHYHPNDVVLIGDQPVQQTYISAKVLILIKGWQPLLFVGSPDRHKSYDLALNTIVNPDDLPCYEEIIAVFEANSGKKSLPSITTLGELEGVA